jgi:acyl-CoA synthetase (AMP-forming)/AMP-acid ligase II
VIRSPTFAPFGELIAYGHHLPNGALQRTADSTKGTVMIHTSPLPAIDIATGMALSELVFRHAASHPDKAALIDGPSGRTITYGQLLDMSRRFAGGLKARGFGNGDVLALMSPNIPEYAVVFHGTAMAGGTVTTVNPTYTAHEVRHQLNDAGASLLVTVAMFAAVATEAAEGTGVTDIFQIGAAEGDRNFVELFGEPIDQVPVAGSDLAVLPYSSGTTGLSKGVMLTHDNLTANILQTMVPAQLRNDETIIAVLPFFHIYGMQVLMNSMLAAGGTIVTMPRFELEGFLKIHQEYGVTRSFVAPPIVVAMAKHPMVDQFDLSKLEQVFSGAAPLSAELALEAGGRLGCDVVQGYGMTELSPVSHLTPPGMFKPGSCGVTAPNTECVIVDPGSGERLGVDVDGELWVRGPQVMAGYLNNVAATEATIDADGWLHTGDIGHFDADGHLFVVDRLKELIKFKGFQVPPAELEALLLTHPAVADSAVIGKPDDEAGEIPIGFVVLKPGQTATADDIKAFVAERVATYKRLGDVTFLDAIPKSASGKILRRMLRDA